MEKDGGQVVSVLEAALADMARAHAVAAVVEYAASEQSVGLRPFSRVIVLLLLQLGLHSVEQISVDDGGLFAFEDFPLEGDFSNIETITE